MKKRHGVLCAFITLLMTTCALDGGNLVGPAGGFVFYDKGSCSEGWRYLECAPKNAGTGDWDKAKQLCDEYRLGGYDDWFLPSKDELKNLLRSGMFNNGVYWSSSEEDSSFAWGIQNGASPNPNSNSYSRGNAQAPDTYRKSGEYWARPTRRF